MMKIVILGLMAAMACAAPPMGMPPMMMPSMMMGGSPLSMLSGGIPPEALDMIKNMKPEDIKAAIADMPPQMMSMIKGMGITEEQLNDAVKNLPEDLTPLVEKVQKSMEDPKQIEEHLNNIPPEMKDKLKDTAISALKTQMGELGMNVKEEDDINSVVEKAKTAIKERMKEEGFDLDDPEAMQAKMMAEMRKITRASPDESDEEVKTKVAKQLLADLKNHGYDVDPEKPAESIEALKDQLKKSLKEMDIDFGDDLDVNNFPEIMQKVLLSGKLGHPLHLMMSAMATFSTGAQPQQMPPQQMMVPVQMQGPMGPGLPYVRGAEDALIHVFGGDDEVIQHLMEVREGAMRGTVAEPALYELMKDLLHYRIEARVLMAQNRMLEEQLAYSHINAMPPFARSPFGLRAMGCRHMH